MKITIEFPNGVTLVLAPEQLNLAQLNATQIALTGRAGDYSIPIVSFPGSIATPEEIAARTKQDCVRHDNECSEHCAGRTKVLPESADKTTHRNTTPFPPLTDVKTQG